MVGLIHKTRILLPTNLEDHVDTSSERDWPPDEFGVRSKATTFEHVWVGNAKVSATLAARLPSLSALRRSQHFTMNPNTNLL